MRHTDIHDPRGHDAVSLISGKGLSELFAAEEGHSLFAVLTVVAAIVAVAVRWYGLATRSLWFDEGYSLWLSQFSFRNIWELLKEDNSPPLYYWLLHCWTLLFGTSAIALRAMSAFFATISIPFFFMVAKQVLPRGPAVLALWLYTICTFQVHYAKDARFYALLAFCSIASLYCLIVFLNKRSLVALVGLVITLSAGLYTHNMMLFYLPGLALAWLLYPSKQSFVQRVRDGLLCGTIVLLIYLPWLPSLVIQVKNVVNLFWVPKPTPWLPGVIFKLSGLEFWHIYKVFFLMLPFWPFRHARAFTVALMLPLVPCLVMAFWRVPPAEQKKGAALLCYSLCPVLLAFFYSLRSTSVFLDRIFIASSAVLLILISCSVGYQTGTNRRLSGTFAIFILLGNAISLVGFSMYYQTEDWPGMMKYLTSLPDQKRLIVLTSTPSQTLFDYYSARIGHPHPMEMDVVEKFSLGYSVSRPKYHSYEEMLTSLRQAAEASDFDEIDVLPSHSPPQLRELIHAYLAGSCASLEEKEFPDKDLKLVRCLGPAKAPHR